MTLNPLSRATVVFALAALVVSLSMGTAMASNSQDNAQVLEDRTEVDGLETTPERSSTSDEGAVEDSELETLGSLLVLVVMLVGVMLFIRIFGWARENYRGKEIRKRARGGDFEEDYRTVPRWSWKDDGVEEQEERWERAPVTTPEASAVVRKGQLDYDGEIQWF